MLLASFLDGSYLILMPGRLWMIGLDGLTVVGCLVAWKLARVVLERLFIGQPSSMVPSFDSTFQMDENR